MEGTVGRSIEGPSGMVPIRHGALPSGMADESGWDGGGGRGGVESEEEGQRYPAHTTMHHARREI